MSAEWTDALSRCSRISVQLVLTHLLAFLEDCWPANRGVPQCRRCALVSESNRGHEPIRREKGCYHYLPDARPLSLRWRSLPSEDPNGQLVLCFGIVPVVSGLVFSYSVPSAPLGHVLHHSGVFPYPLVTVCLCTVAEQQILKGSASCRQL